MQEQFEYSADGHKGLEDYILNMAQVLINDLEGYIDDEECTRSDVHSALDRLMALTDIGISENFYVSESARRRLRLINENSMILIRKYNISGH